MDVFRVKQSRHRGFQWLRRAHHRLRQSYQLVSLTLKEFVRHRGQLLAAALAFYTLLSLAPLVIVAVAVAGMVLGRGTAHAEMIRVLHETVGENAAAVIDAWVAEASESGELASLVGVGLMLGAASKLGKQLREALNQVWDIDADALIPGLRTLLRRRLVSLGLAIAAGPALLVIVTSRALLSALHGVWFGSAQALGVVIQALQIAFSLATAAGLFAMIFRIMPDAKVSWKSAWRGGAVASVLFNAGNALVGLYLGSASAAAPYGAAGSVLVLLLWLHFSAHILLLAAEFTQVQAKWTAPPFA
jgi:membrane protein